MLKNMIKAMFKKEPDRIVVNIDRCDPSLTVRLFLNGRLGARMQCVVESDTTILIGDILHHNKSIHYNKGYGSQMMQAFLNYAGEHHFQYVYGNLSIVDLDHKDRLHHFYQKFGFTIIEYPELQAPYYGKIELHLL